jgi:glycosyltransferase involved in cell wall biosynthesis
LKKILFIVSEDWYFVSHRLHLAIVAIDNGYEVGLLSRLSTHQDLINSFGIKTYDWPMERSSKNPFKELVSIYHVVKILQSFRPNLVHAVSIKPVIYSILSKLFYRMDGLILALAGLGFVFRSKKTSAKIIRLFITPIFRLMLINNNIRLVLQNKDDAKLLMNLKIANNKIRIIRGAGVSTKDFFPNHESHLVPLVILPARMLWNKGVQDFVNCAKKFNTNEVKVRFALIGDPDLHNPESIAEAQLNEWVEQGFVEWWGRQDRMIKVYHMADIVCFPSYHEGLPKALLESASCEIPIVAYDVSGCREIVKDKVNGYLIPFKDENGLYDAVMKLLNNRSLSRQMGRNGREIVIENFTDSRIALETLKVWEEV